MEQSTHVHRSIIAIFIKTFLLIIFLSIGLYFGIRLGEGYYNFDSCREENQSIRNEYDAGYSVGYDAGWDDGWEEGHIDGMADGYSEAYTEGYDAGYDACFDAIS